MPGLFHGTSLERPVTCPHCGLLTAECTCPRDATGQVRHPCDQHPRVRREKRRGNWTTIIADLDPQATDLKALLKQLRTNLGTGGGLTDNQIILQGDHKQAVIDQLIALGYKAKPAGG
jgi:translation initiation factor 1